MRKLIFVIAFLFELYGCSQSYIQLFETSAIKPTKFENNFFVFETDTLKITYSFYAEKGVMSFSVFNKLDKPIYIDWKTSSFIYNDNKLNYWVDETRSKISSYSNGYYYRGPLIKAGYTAYEGMQNAIIQSVKPERITFVPPKSYTYKSSFYLYPFLNFVLPTAPYDVQHRNDDTSKITTVYYQRFNPINSPLRFRNYLAFSFSETTPQYFYIDNSFCLTSVQEMDFRHFKGKSLGFYKEGREVFQFPYSNNKTSFYLKIPSKLSIATKVQSIIPNREYSK